MHRTCAAPLCFTKADRTTLIRPGHRFGRVAAVALFALLACAGAAAAQDLPNPPQNLETIHRGSLVIPMDLENQNLVAPFNMKAYGLVNLLLHNNIPVKWAIRSGKLKDEIDFSAVAHRISPSATGVASYDFRSGPFIVPESWAPTALPLIASFGNNVAVFELDEDKVVDVRYTLTHRPEVWINTKNASIHTQVMDEAGIPDYVVSDTYSILSNSCYTLATEPHNDKADGVPEVRNYVETGGNFLAQCRSTDTYENEPTYGHFLTDLGVKSNNKGNALTYLYPDLALLQFEDDLEPNPGGSETDWRLETGSSFQPTGFPLAENIGVTPTTWALMAGKMYPGGPGGMVIYLGGHDYGTSSDILMMNGRRILLNAVMMPPTRPPSCGLTITIPDLTVQKTHVDPVVYGDTLQYDLMVTNAGDAATVDTIAVVDTLPAGVTYLSGSGSGWTFSVNGQIVTAMYTATLGVGANTGFQILGTVSAPAGTELVNVAYVSGGGEVNTGNDADPDTANVQAAPPNLVIAKRHTAPFVDGFQGAYTLVVTNVGLGATTDTITVTDPLPAGLTYVSGAGAGWSFIGSAGTVTAKHSGPLAAGDSLVSTITVDVGAAAVPLTVNTASVTTPGDTNPGDDSGTDSTSVAGSPDLSVAKRHTAPFTDGAPGTYTLVVTNSGTAATGDTIVVDDILPAGFTFQSGAGAGWSFAAFADTVRARNAGPLVPGDSLVFTLTVDVGPGAVPSVTNTASVATSGDPFPGNNSGSDPTTVGGAPDLALSKRHTAAFTDGGQGTYTLVVTNTGTAATTGSITVDDVLPAGLTYASGAGAGWSFATIADTVRATSPGPIAPGDSLVFTLIVDVTPSAVPSVTNTATASTTGDPYNGNDSASDVTAVGGAPDLALIKRHTAAFVDGTQGTYTIVVTNVGTGPTTGNITVADPLPAGLTYVSGAGVGWGFAEAGGTVTATHAGPIAVGDSLVFTLTVDASSAAVPSVTNTATASTVGDPYNGNDSASDPTSVGGAPDLMITKRHTTTLTDGAQGTYTIVVTNVGTGPTTGMITMTDVIPAGLTYVSAVAPDWGFAESGGTVTASHGVPLAPGDSLVFTLNVMAGPGAVPSVTNTATVTTAGDPNSGNNSASDVTAVGGAPDLALIKRHTVAFVDGAQGTYTFVVTNVGTGPTTGNITVTDPLPAGLTYVSGAGAGWGLAEAGGTVTATHAGPIAVGDSLVFTLIVDVTPSAVPSVTNTATASTTGDPYNGNDSGTDVTAVGGAPDLALIKRHTAAFVDGTQGTYTFVVTNVGTGPTTGDITVTDPLPAGLTYGSGAGTGWSFAQAGGTVTATHAGPVAPGDSLVFTLNVAVGAAAVPGVTNTASVATSGDVNAANDSASDPTAVGGVVDLALSKRHTNTFTDGGTGPYTFVVTNLGSAPTTGTITVTDPLPAGLSYISGAGTGWGFAEAGGTVTATHTGPIAPGDSLVFTLDVSVGAAAVPGVTNTASVATSGDVNASNDSASDPTAVGGVVDLALAKRHTNTFTDGSTGTYTFVVTNVGSGATAGAITVTDPLPAGLSYVSGAGTGWGFAEASGTVTATHASPIAAGDSLVFTLDVSVSAAAVPGVTNTATVNASGDVNPANDVANDPTAVGGAVDLSLVKRHTAAFTDGGSGTYTFVVTNLGSAATTGNITVTDPLPAGLTYTSGAGAGWSFAQAGGTVTATHAGPIAPGDSLGFTLNVSVGAAAVPGVTNTASVATSGDVNAANDSASDPTTVGGIVDLALSKRHTGSLYVGANGTYTLVVTNVGSAATTGGITVTDPMPAGLTYVSGAGTGWTFAEAGGTVTASHAGPIAPGDSLVFTLTVGVDASAIPNVTNTATTFTPGDANGTNNASADQAVVGVPDVTVHKSHVSDFTVGAPGTYLLTVTNVGTAPTSGAITVTDSLPAGLTFASGAGTGWSFAESGGVVTATHAGPLDSGNSLLFNVTVNVDGAAMPSVVNSASVTTADDPNPGNDTSTDTPATVTNVVSLMVEKRSSVTEAEIGDVVDFSVRVSNTGLGDVTGVTIDDALPAGFSYVPGTARLDGVATTDPAGGRGPNLTFTVDTLMVGRTRTLTYRVEIGAGADLGDGVNRATARDATGGTSNTAAAGIKLRSGAFSEEGVIVGKVYMDCSCDTNRVQQAEDLGIPGVRVFLEDGSWAVTDAEGKFHFDAVQPRTHVLRLDPTTLPAGAQMAAAANRNGRDPMSLFVDMQEGELHSADFIEASCSDTVRNLIHERRLTGASALEVPPLERAAAGVNPMPGRASLLMAGLLEARFDVRALSNGRLSLATRRDRFEDRLGDLAFDAGDGRVHGGARGALFMTGKVGDDVGVTVRYDNEADPRARLFRDIRPEEFYPAYGDAGQRGFEARSTSRLYARVEKAGSYAAFGDFTTPVNEGLAQLGAYHRSLNGAVSRVERGPVTVDAFATEGRSHQVVDEIPARGVSGPYALSRNDALANSEIVEVVTRDRNQPSRVLKREMKTRFTDYVVEPLTGDIVFRAPVPSVDLDLNPVSIRVTYESENGGRQEWVTGGNARWKATDKLELGGSMVRDGNLSGDLDLVSGQARFDVAPGTELLAEAARSDSGGLTTGRAGRFELRHHSDRFQASAYGAQTGVGFHNPSSAFGAGRRELGLRGRFALDPRTSLFTEMLQTEDRVTGGKRTGTLTGISGRIADHMTAELAYRQAHETAAAAGVTTIGATPNDTRALRARLTTELSRRLTAFGEFEQDLSATEQRRAVLGGDFRMARMQLHARHELMSSFAGPYALNGVQEQARTVIGISAEPMAGTRAFSEYRLRDAFDGREAQAALGLASRWSLQPGLRVDASIERLTILEGNDLGEATSLAGGLEYTGAPLWKGHARLEYRNARAGDRWLGSFGYARKLDRNWTLLGETTFGRLPDEDRTTENTQFGLAFRQTRAGEWNALLRYTHRLDNRRGLDGLRTRDGAHVLSGHVSVRPAGLFELQGQLATKWAHNESAGLTTNSNANLFGTRLTRDIGGGWDFGISARSMFSHGTDSRRYGFGYEIGRVLGLNLRAAAGYNVFGFHEVDLTGADFTDHGPYAKIGFKFDEGLFGMSRPRVEPPPQTVPAPPMTDTLRTAAPRDLQRTLTPERRRLTDVAMRNDVALMDAWAGRLEAAAVKPTADPYRVARGRALLALARNEYLDDDETGVVDAAFAHAVTTVEELEAGAQDLPAPLDSLPGVTEVRPDLWTVVHEIRKDYGAHCAGEALGRLEVELLWAGNDQACGPCIAAPHVAKAERLAAEARKLADACVPPPPVVVVPEDEIAPIDPRRMEIPVPGPPVALPEAKVPIAFEQIDNVVHFALNDARLGPASREVLRGVAELLRLYGEVSVELQGHTDSRGSVPYNLALARRRAAAVRRYLEMSGVDPERISISVLGKAEPFAQGDLPVDHALNRRVELLFNAPGVKRLQPVRQDDDLQIERNARPRAADKKKQTNEPTASQ